MLLAARDEETGEGMNDKQLRDEVLTLMIAGHETTANALAWTWYLLAKHDDVAKRLDRELAEVLGGATPTVEDLPRLSYTRMVIEESMRLYPPAWATSRNAIAADGIGGFGIPAKSVVLLSPFVTHRHPDVWKRPDEFDPERFSPDRAAARPRFAYYPFGGGPRLCIGNAFALTEMSLVVATVAQRYRLELTKPEREIEPAALITLRPRGGIAMKPVTIHP